MTTQPEALPPLPKPAAHLAGWDAGWSQYHDQHDPLPEQWDDKPDCIAALFTADQMRAYATEHAARLHAECEALRADAERWREARSRMSWVEYNADSLRWMFVVEMAHPEPGETKESIFGRLDEALAARAAKEQA